jgi:hypothetical protein
MPTDLPSVGLSQVGPIDRLVRAFSASQHLRSKGRVFLTGLCGVCAFLVNTKRRQVGKGTMTTVSLVFLAATGAPVLFEENPSQKKGLSGQAHRFFIAR